MIFVCKNNTIIHHKIIFITRLSSHIKYSRVYYIRVIIISIFVRFTPLHIQRRRTLFVKGASLPARHRRWLIGVFFTKFESSKNVQWCNILHLFSFLLRFPLRIWNAHSGAFSRNAFIVSAKSNGSMRIFDAQRCNMFYPFAQLFQKVEPNIWSAKYRL